jgi:hypothetical protein
MFSSPSFYYAQKDLDPDNMMSTPSIHHSQLSTTFLGLRHSISSETQVWQFRGIKYGTVPCRFKQSIIYSAFPEIYDATSYG